MPREGYDRDYPTAYSQGYQDGYAEALRQSKAVQDSYFQKHPSLKITKGRQVKRKLSAWNMFVKANSNKKKFQYANGKLKLKKMGIAYRKKKRWITKHNS